MEPSAFLDGATVTISDRTYAVCRTEETYATAFATVRDGTETTTIIAEDALDSVAYESIERGWKRLTFDVELPFELVGFLATVATALADAEVSVFVLSSYSTDHLLVQTDDIATAASTLVDLGCDVN
ncbi:ACT domain-containing protein [Halorhabdus amylolytica]|uniref:ACT domain-containing protein n=1 Tax=Halorhabdus amylolytica TaxID=2559573 RepID=UPI0010A9B3EE|nr:ACT domain-containing protein [Halorhabdus amylolytica]